MSDFLISIPKASVDASHERFVVDHNRCILCTRCVRVCDEIEGRSHLGRHGTWHQFARHHRFERALGHFGHLHELR